MSGLAVLLAGCAVAVLPSTARTLPRPRTAREHVRFALSPRAGLLIGGVAGVCLAFAGLGLVGLVVGAVSGVGLRVLVARRVPPSVAVARATVVADLPWTLDLLAAVTTAGAPPHEGVAAVADALGPVSELGRRLATVAAALALGAEQGAAWEAAATAGGEALEPVGEAYSAAAHDGSRLAARLTAQAQAARETAAAEALAAAQRAGVRSVLPLGLCYLPAFVLLGIVPVVAAAFHKL